jgi:hypothetical protein
MARIQHYTPIYNLRRDRNLRYYYDVDDVFLSDCFSGTSKAHAALTTTTCSEKAITVTIMIDFGDKQNEA